MSARGDPAAPPAHVRFAPIATKLLRHSGTPRGANRGAMRRSKTAWACASIGVQI